MKLVAQPAPLNDKGITHYIAPLAIVTVIAVAGVFSVVASHAAQSTAAKKVKIVSAKIKVVSQSSPYYMNKLWCVDADVVYTVKIKGTVDSVAVGPPKTQVLATDLNTVTPTNLVNKGKGVWTGTDGTNADKSGYTSITHICAARQGQKVHVGRKNYAIATVGDKVYSKQLSTAVVVVK